MKSMLCFDTNMSDLILAGVGGPSGPQKLMVKCWKFLRKQLFQGLIISIFQKYRRYAQNIGINRKLGKNRKNKSTGQPGNYVYIDPPLILLTDYFFDHTICESKLR